MSKAQEWADYLATFKSGKYAKDDQAIFGHGPITLTAGDVREWASLLAQRDALLEAAQGTHNLTVRDHYTGTAPDSPRWWTCRLCEWVWPDGDDETHPENCPNAMVAAAIATAEGPAS